ncbi:MAG: XRE family transcriptional regulator [Oscillospiraceae bacterium]|nr:XRE family transcriptional regulator [Oscillospiraceae bacterium]
MEKNTSEIVKELGLCPDFQTFYTENKDYMVSQRLTDLLSQLLESKGLQKAQVIKKAELSEVYGYQIFSGIRVPERKKLLCIAVGMHLNIEETQQLLKCAGYAQLYVKLPFDSIVLYGLCKGLSVVQINGLLYEYGLETLG